MTKTGWVLVGLAAVVGVVVIAKRAEAQPQPLPGPARDVFPPIPGPAPAAQTARVLQTTNVRSGPTTGSGKIGSAPAGSSVRVLQTGIASAEPASREWWRIALPSGVEGFASAVGPQGEHNLEIA